MFDLRALDLLLLKVCFGSFHLKALDWQVWFGKLVLVLSFRASDLRSFTYLRSSSYSRLSSFLCHHYIRSHLRSLGHLYISDLLCT